MCGCSCRECCFCRPQGQTCVDGRGSLSASYYLPHLTSPPSHPSCPRAARRRPRQMARRPRRQPAPLHRRARLTRTMTSTAELARRAEHAQHAELAWRTACPQALVLQALSWLSPRPANSRGLSTPQPCFCTPAVLGRALRAPRVTRPATSLDRCFCCRLPALPSGSDLPL